MSIPSVKASTQNVDQGGDKISLARADIKQNIDNVNQIIDHLGASGASTLVIPLGGFVVQNWSGSTGFDSAGNKNFFFRMALLGGAYYLRDETLTSSPSLTAAESSYGAIEGASVNTATPTLVEPTGYSWTGINTSGNITNGFINNTGNLNFTQTTGNIDIVSGNGGQAYIGYGEGYDSYVTLAAGTYIVEVKFVESTLDSSYIDNAVTEAQSDSYTSNDFDFFIWNKTDEIDILNSMAGGATDKIAMSQIDKWRYNNAAVFTLAGTKDIQFFNPGVDQPMEDDATVPAADKDYLAWRYSTASPTLTGDVYNISGNVKAAYKDGVGLPGKLGWVDVVPNTYIKITKLA